MDKLLATCGFAIGTSDEATIKANAAEDGVTLDWDKVNADIRVIESKMIKWLDDLFGSARDEGHDSDGDLVGTLFIYKNLDVVKDSLDIGEPLRTSSGTLQLPEMSLTYPELIDISIDFYDLVEENTSDSENESGAFEEEDGFDVESMRRNASAWSKEQADEVAELDAEFDTFLASEGIDPNSKKLLMLGERVFRIE